MKVVAKDSMMARKQVRECNKLVSCVINELNVNDAPLQRLKRSSARETSWRRLTIPSSWNSITPSRRSVSRVRETSLKLLSFQFRSLSLLIFPSLPISHRKPLLCNGVHTRRGFVCAVERNRILRGINDLPGDTLTKKSDSLRVVFYEERSNTLQQQFFLSFFPCVGWSLSFDESLSSFVILNLWVRTCLLLILGLIFLVCIQRTRIWTPMTSPSSACFLMPIFPRNSTNATANSTRPRLSLLWSICIHKI